MIEKGQIIQGVSKKKSMSFLQLLFKRLSWLKSFEIFRYVQFSVHISRDQSSFNRGRYPLWLVDSVLVIGALTRFALLHSWCDLKAVQTNAQRSLIQELMFSEFTLSHNAVEATKSICCAKGEGTVDHSTVKRWLKKFRSDSKNLDNQTRSGRPKTVDYVILLKAMEINSASSTRRVWSKLGISQSSVVRHLYDLCKNIWSCRIIIQNIAKLLSHPSIFFELWKHWQRSFAWSS